jgi:acetyl esterase
MMDWFMGHYASDERSPAASPLFERDLRGVAPALVVTAGFDPLRDEGEAYAARLRDAGVRVIELHEPTLTHGFVHFGGVSAPCRRALLGIARDAGRLLRDT